MKKASKNITTLDELLDKKYGKRGSKKRDKWEQEFEAFRLGVMLEQARTNLGMTQAELADKCGTNKSYIQVIKFLCKLNQASLVINRENCFLIEVGFEF